MNECRQQQKVKAADLEKQLVTLRKELVAKEDELHTLQSALQQTKEQHRAETAATKQALQRAVDEAHAAAKKSQDAQLEWQATCNVLKADVAKAENKLLQSEDIIADYKKIVETANQSKDVRLAELEETEKKLADVKGALEVAFPFKRVAGARKVCAA